MKHGKKILSLLLALAMAVGMAPMPALAEENTEVKCVCVDAACTEDQFNKDCPVCGIPEADLTKCAKYTPPTAPVEPIADPIEATTEAPTQDPTEESTEAPTQDPTEESTEAPTQDPTEESTEASEPDPVCVCEGLPACAEGAMNDCAFCIEGLGQCLGTPVEEEPQVLTITDWQWDDPEAYVVDNALGLPGVSEDCPLDWETLLTMLPQTITAVIDGQAREVTLTWSSADFLAEEDGRYPTQGTFTLSAALPEGYVLGEGVAPLTLTLELGGGMVYGNAGDLQVDGDAYTYDESTHTLTITGDVTVSGTTTQDKIVVSGTNVNVTLSGLNIECGSGNAFALAEDASCTLTLAGGTENVLDSSKSHGCAGVYVPGGATLTITGDGSLKVGSGAWASGIGNNSGTTPGTIHIKGGNIDATGITAAPAIRGSSVYISVGTVNAQGEYGGISGTTVNITSGTVTATGKSNNPGIKGTTSVTISGGTVTATGHGSAPGIQGTFTTGEDGNAFIKANNPIEDQSNRESWQGIILDGNSGLVRGDQTLPEDLTIGDNQALTIPEDSSLTIPEGKTLTNNGFIQIEGTLTNQGTLQNNHTILGKVSGSGAVTGNPVGQIDGLTVTGGEYGTDYVFDPVTGTMTILQNTPLTLSGSTKKVKIAVAATVAANVTLNGLTSNLTSGNAFALAEGASCILTLADGTDNVLKTTAHSKAGVNVPGGTILTIGGGGSLTAGSGSWAAGIGNNRVEPGNTTGEINIEGGNIYVSEVACAPAIGNSNDDGGTINISGGTVVAEVKTAYVPGCIGGNNCAVNITGGTVTARGTGDDVKGIRGSSVTISGGTVTAIGHNNAPGIDGTFTTGENGDAFIKANSITDKTSQVSWKGIIVTNDAIVIGGEQTLPENLTVEANQTLTILPEAELTIPVGKELINNGTVNIQGTLTNNGSITNHALIEATGTLTNNTSIANSGTILGTVSGGTVTGNSINEFHLDGITVTGGTYGTDYTYDTATKTLTILKNTHLTISGTTTTAKIVVAAGVNANITLAGLDIQVKEGNAFALAEDASCILTLADGTDNVLKTTAHLKAGVNVPDGTILTIGGDGSLKVGSGAWASGIGNNSGTTPGTIHIKGGNIDATGIIAAPAIRGSSVYISGGTVNAQGEYGGISGTTVNITSGTVTATGKSNNPGIKGTFTTGENGDAFIKANSITDKSSQVSWKGIIVTNDAIVIGGEQTLPENLTVEANQTLTILPEAELTIPVGKTLTNNGTVTNSGTLTIGGETSLAGTKNLEGEGDFILAASSSLITVPTDLVYNGQDQTAVATAAISMPTSKTILGQEFKVPGNWRRQDITPEEVKDVGEYTVTYGNGSKTIQKTFTVAQSASELPEKNITLDKEGAYTYGETITVTAKPTPTGNKPQTARAFTKPTANQMAIYKGMEQISEAVSPGTEGKYVMTVSTTALGVGTHTLTAQYVGNDNMAGTTQTFDVTVNPKSLTASVGGSHTKTYDGGTTCDGTGLRVDLGGVKTGDDVTATASYAYSDANAGSNKTITATGVSLSGADAGNYSFTGTSATGNVGKITQKALTITANHQTISFGQSIPEGVNQVTADSLANGDTLTGITLTADTTDVTTSGTITPSAAKIEKGTEDVTGNYDITYTSGTLTILNAGQPALSITGQPLQVVYGDSFTLGTSGGVAGGTVTWEASGCATVDNSGNVTITGVGEFTITATKSCYGYNDALATYEATAGRRPLTITGTTVDNKTYDGNTNATVTKDGTIQNSVLADNITIASVTAAFDDPNVETDKTVSVAYTLAGNYEDLYTVSLTATLTASIQKKDLTIGAKDHTITYGDAPAGNGVSYFGFVSGEDKAVLNGTLGYDFSYTQYGDVGNNYTITPKGMTSGNYEITFQNGTLTVDPLEAALSWPTLTSGELVYDGNPKTLTATVTNAVNNDSVVVTVVPVGENTDVTGTPFKYQATALSSSNYALPTDVFSPEYTITAKPITETDFTVDIADKTYTGSQIKPTVTSSLPVDGYKVQYGTNVDAGEGKITIEGCGNYGGKLEYTFNIVQSENQWTTDPSISDWTYGQVENAPTAAAKFGTVQFTYCDKDKQNPSATAPTDAGTYFLKAAVEATADYTGLEEFVKFTIDKAPLTLATDNLTVTKVYDGTTSAGTLTVDGALNISGLVGAETVDLTVTPGAYADADAEAGKTIMLMLALNDQDSNYSVTDCQFTEAVIEQKEVGLEWAAPANLIYDGQPKVPSVEATGLISGDTVSVSIATTDSHTNAGDTFAYTAASLDNPNYKLPSDSAVLTSDSYTIEAYSLNKSDFQVNLENRVYTGEDIEPDVTSVKSFIHETDFKIDYGANRDVGTATITITGTGNCKETVTYTFQIIKANPEVTWPEGLSGDTGKKLSTVALEEGFSWNEPDTVIVYDVNTYPMTFTPEDTDNFNVLEMDVEVRGNDVEPPTAAIQIADDSWSQFLSDITFGYFKETQKVTITASDLHSGVASIQYFVTATARTLEQVKAHTAWTTYTGSFNLDPDGRFIVYAKVTDNAGNTLYLSSDGLVLDATAPAISGIENGKTYLEEATFTVKDDYLGTVTVDGKTVTLTEGKYTIPADNKDHIVAATDKAGNSVAYRITVLEVYTVTYMAGDQVVDTQRVPYGSDAEPPEVPAKSGYSGKWDHDGKNITEDTIITAKYIKSWWDNPKTGDAIRGVLMVLVVSAIALAGIGGYALWQKKRKM